MKTVPQYAPCFCSYLSMCQRKNRFSLSGKEGGCGKQAISTLFYFFNWRMVRATAHRCSGCPLPRGPSKTPPGGWNAARAHCQAMHPPRDTFSYGLSIRQAMPPEAATGQKDHNFLMHKEVPYGLAGTLRVGNVAKHSRKETNKSGKKQPQKEPPQKQGLRVPGTEFVQKLSWLL